MAEETLAPHPPQDSLMVRPVEAGSHAPGAGLRIPRERELKDLASRRLIEVGAGMVARAEDPVHGLLEDVDRLAGGIELPAPEHEAAVPAEHLEDLRRRPVDER